MAFPNRWGTTALRTRCTRGDHAMRLLQARRGRMAAVSPAQVGFAVLDLETTGLSPRTDRIVEVAVVRLDARSAVVSEFCTLVNPERDIGPTRIHGLRASDVATAPRFADIAGVLLSQLAGHLPVGHNVQFDLRFLDAELARLGARLPQGLTGLCTMRLARSYLNGHAGRTLGACCQAAGVPLSQAHQALGDARAVAGLLAVYGAATQPCPMIGRSVWTKRPRSCGRACWSPPSSPSPASSPPASRPPNSTT
jgi:DNA polymerase III epsilon subunit-like protein